MYQSNADISSTKKPSYSLGVSASFLRNASRQHLHIEARGRSTKLYRAALPFCSPFSLSPFFVTTLKLLTCFLSTSECT